jgi:hypothetical protein
MNVGKIGQIGQSHDEQDKLDGSAGGGGSYRSLRSTTVGVTVAAVPALDRGDDIAEKRPAVVSLLQAKIQTWDTVDFVSKFN